MASKDIRIMMDNNSEHSSSSDFENDSATFPESRVGRANSWSIHKVPRQLRQVNEKAYEPSVISIGPYHHGKADLKATEDIKRRCLDETLEKCNLDMKAFREAMKPLEERARKCYRDIPDFDNEEFVKMMIHDGCFLVRLINRDHPKEDLLQLERIQTEIWYDLLLLENQLPFFVLFELYSVIAPNGDDFDQFARSALSFFGGKGRGPKIWPWLERENCPPEKDTKHLLDLVHNCFCPSEQRTEQHKKAKENAFRRWKFIRSATELEEAGIKFGVQDQDQGLFDIEFTEDTKELKIPLFSDAKKLKIPTFGTKRLKIPTLFVDDNTERILRNFMAYEQFLPSGEPRYVTDYVSFMDNLINTGKDVQLLCNSQIIDNCLGGDKAVAKMFNKLRESIFWSEDNYYAEIFWRIDNYYQREWNKYRAKLMRDYFNCPWSFIKFLAAVVLLLLTIVQTIFSVLSNVHQ